MDINAAPGPDGLPVGFYREFCQEIKSILLEMFQDLYRGNMNLKRLNYGMISLIPKLKEANNIRQYRPICLLNVDYKWFKKVFTVRVTPYTDKLISSTQTTFIPQRYTLESVIILHEILHELGVKKMKGAALKLDSEKAYDKVRWSFTMEVLKKKNFLEIWLKWMKQIIEGGNVGININGALGQFFNTHKGLRLYMSKRATRPGLARARLGPVYFVSGHARPRAATAAQARAHKLFFVPVGPGKFVRLRQPIARSSEEGWRRRHAQAAEVAWPGARGRCRAGGEAGWP
jgi:hypothetical protein